MTEKYLVSVCFVNNNQEIFSEPFGIFNSLLEAEQFAVKKIVELKNEFIKELGCQYDELEELYEFDYTLKEIIDGS